MLTPYPYGARAERDDNSLNQVLAMLGITFLFSAAGALFGLWLGDAAILISLVGGIITFVALMIMRRQEPLNLVLLYGFATFEGMALGPILDGYVSAGLGQAVVGAALTTAIVALGAGLWGATTRRNLSGLGGVLFAGLIAVVAASFVGLLIGSSASTTTVSAVSALVFTGLIAVDCNRVTAQGRLSRDGAVMATVNIYLDMLNLFEALLRLFGAGESSRR